MLCKAVEYLAYMTDTCYMQDHAFWVQPFCDFAAIEKFLCHQIFPTDRNVKLPHISSFFILTKKGHFQDLKQ